MTVVNGLATKGPVACLQNFLAGRGLADGPDGRPLYRYGCRTQELETLRALIADEKYPIEQRMQLVPLVAAEHFRRAYREGPWSWEACGLAVTKLRLSAGMRFGPLLLRALAYWNIKVVSGDGMRRHYLGTLVLNSGFPVAFVEGQSALRGLLKRLIAECVRSGTPAAQQRAALEIPVSRLPRGYRRSHDFEKLCVDLAAAVAELARNFEPRKQSLANYLEHIPDWEAGLPLRLDSSEATQLLQELMQTAREVGVPGSLDNAVCIRELYCDGGTWHLAARLAPLPDSLEPLHGQPPSVLKLGLAVDGTAVRLLASLCRQPSGRYVVRPRPRPDQLVIPAPFSEPSSGVGLIATSAGYMRQLPVRDGEALDPSSPWLFVLHEGEDRGLPSERWRFLAQGDVRVRDTRALISVMEGAVVEGDALAAGTMSTATGDRQLWEITGQVNVLSGGESYSIRTCSTQDPLLIDIRGQALPMHSPEAGAAFAGAPAVQLREAEPDIALEWKSSASKEWSSNLGEAIGVVIYRARRSEEILARRKALVLPRQFEYDYQSGTAGAGFYLTLGPGWLVSGMCKPRPIDTEEGRWFVPATEAPGQVARASIFVRTPPSLPPSFATIELSSHTNISGFREFVTREAAPQRTTMDRIGRYEACKATHAGRLVFVSWGTNQTMPIICEMEHARGYSLPLSWIERELQELDASRLQIDERLRLEIFERGRPSTLEVSPVRLRCQDNLIVVDAGGEVVSPQFQLSIRHFSVEAKTILVAHPTKSGVWQLPDSFPAGWSLVTANAPSVRPQAVRLDNATEEPESICDLAQLLQSDLPSSQRMEALRECIRDIAASPLAATNHDNLSFLLSWLTRFGDVPSPYLDMARGLLDEREATLRLLTYSGASKTDVLAQRAAEAPLWWHTMPMGAWRALAPWWRHAITDQQDEGGAADGTFDSIIDAYVESLHLSDEDRERLTVILHGTVRGELSGPVAQLFAAQAGKQYEQDFVQWNRCLASAVDGGAQLMPLALVDAYVHDVEERLPKALSRQCDPARRSYLLAPAICAVAGALGTATAALRRELMLARRYDRALFDALFANAQIQLACNPVNS